MRDSQNEQSMETRLGRLEVSVENLTGNVESLASSVKTLIDSQKTKWSPILGAVALGISILGGLITLGARGPLSDLDAVKQAVIQQGEIRADNSYKAGLAEGLAKSVQSRVDRVQLDLEKQKEAELEQLKDILQRIATLEERVRLGEGPTFHKDD